MRIVLLALGLLPLLGQDANPPQILMPLPGGQKATLELPLPNKPELDAADARAVLEAQRAQGFAWNEANRLRAEYLEAQRRAEAADQTVLALLTKLKDKYGCQACDLNWKMKWEAPQGLKFNEAKK